MGKHLLRIALAGGLALVLATASEARGRRVLLLQSADRGNLGLDEFTANLRLSLDGRFAEPLTFTQFVVTPAGYTATPERAVLEYLRSVSAGQPEPDLVVTVGGLAAVFARKHRAELFPRSPLLLAATDRRFIEATPLADDETAVAVDNDPRALVEDILRLLPQTSTVFIVIGSGERGEFWRTQLDQEFARLRDRVRFEWFVDRTFQQIVRRVSTLPPHYAILYITFGQDAQGGAYADEAALAELHAVASAPMFATQSVAIGHGVVGGTLMSIDRLTATAADVAFRILNGESPGAIRTPVQRPGPPLFDWRELQRWNIDESRLTPGSLVLFREPTLWERYRRYLVGIVAILIVQSLFIGALVFERRARRQADGRARQQLAISAHLERRLAMGEMAAALAHELNQPLSAIRFNAEAADRLLGSNRGSIDDLREILRDITREDARASEIIQRQRAMLQKRAVEHRPLDLNDVVRESLAIVAHHAESKRVRIDAEPGGGSCLVNGDQVTLQQVVVNLVVNAIDAMASTPPSDRRLVVTTTATPHGVEVAVQDFGEGIAPDMMSRLFDPFVSTKADGMGIGLTVVRGIVEAHGGTIQARNNSGRGATFSFKLPVIGATWDAARHANEFVAAG
jgi:signal transduction histidine kinase